MGELRWTAVECGGAAEFYWECEMKAGATCLLDNFYFSKLHI